MSSVTTNIKNPKTIQDLIDLREKIKAKAELQKRIEEEYIIRLRVEQQGGVYTPPNDLKHIESLNPSSGGGNLEQKNAVEAPSSQHDKDSSDISTTIFKNTEEEKKQ